MRNILPYCLPFLLLPCSFAAPSQPLQHEQIKQAYYDSYACERKHDYAGALRALSPVLTAYPSGYTVNYRCGWLSYCDSSFTDALACYRKAQLIYPSSLEIINSITIVFAAQRDWPSVEKEALKAVKIDYYNTIANYWYARSLMFNGKYRLSEEVSRKMLAVLPTSVTFLVTLGETLFTVKKFDEARELFLSCIILDPENKTANRYLPLCTGGSKRTKKRSK
ncbi:MAG: hypothetical protein JW863_19255 [Chitinispirillaceae bacterium]|nr:hypothetical protein [Chitinispirillaceae bacterium]